MGTVGIFSYSIEIIINDLTASFPWQPDSALNESRDGGVAVASAGPQTSHLHLALYVHMYTLNRKKVAAHLWS